MKFIVDVGVGRSVEEQLRVEGHTALPVRDRNPHMPDVEILEWALAEQAIVVTMDKDFGDLVWKQQRPHVGILLLRMEEATGPERAAVMSLLVRDFSHELSGNFAVYKNERLRISR